jgi:DNA-binding beta-propeller fold protein YncE
MASSPLETPLVSPHFIHLSAMKRLLCRLCWLAGLLVLAPSLHARAQDWQYPLNVAAAPDGTLYVIDRNLPGLWKVTPTGEKSVFFQASKKFRTPLNAARCVAVDHEGRVLAGDSATREVYRFNAAGEPEPLTKGGIGIAMGIAVGSTGKVFVADLELHRICRLPAEGGKAETFVEIQAPRALTIDAKDRLWVISDAPKRGEKEVRQVVRIDPDGKQETIVQGRVFAFPGGIALDDKEVAYISDGYSKAIWKIPSQGTPKKWISGEPLDHPVGIYWQKDRLLIADPRAKAIFSATSDGKLSRLVE